MHEAHTSDTNLAAHTHSYISLNKRIVCVEHPSKMSKNITVRQVAVICKQERGIDTIDYVIQLTNATSASGNFRIGDSSPCVHHIFFLSIIISHASPRSRGCVVYAGKMPFLLPIRTMTIIDLRSPIKKLTRLRKVFNIFLYKIRNIYIS